MFYKLIFPIVFLFIQYLFQGQVQDSITPAQTPAPTETPIVSLRELIRTELIGLGFYNQGQLAWNSTAPIEVSILEDEFTQEWEAIGDGESYANFVLGFDVTWDTTGPYSGCGAYLRSDGNFETGTQLLFETYRFEEYTSVWEVLHFHLGRYIDIVSSDVYESVDINGENQSTNHHVLIVNGRNVTAFANGKILGIATAPSGMRTGEIALVAHQESDTTTCVFNNVWIWELIE
jgi:hypothetical protein